MNAFDNPSSTNKNSTYNVGIYLRLSKEDELSGQSESINNQRDFITSYVIHQGWNIVEVYIDDGFSGLNFNRPAFKRMVADIESKKINLVITKDLSRLGRDYIDTGYYLERYFPENNVRYIALNDGIDTFSNSTNNDMSPFKSVINDLYAKDISKKIRAVMDTKRKNGKFIGAFAPYGYKKAPQNKNSFIIDEEAAHIVKRIFESYMSGDSMQNITKTLNAERIPCPAKYKEFSSSYKNAMVKHYLWTQETVKRILTNPTYAGNMSQGRQVKINYKIEKYRKIPQKDWIIAKNTHEPIVSPEDFAFVQELIQKKIIHYDKREEAAHLLNGLLFCRDCGAKMTYRRNTSKKMVIICGTYNKFGPSMCKRNSIQEKIVEDHVIKELKKISKDIIKDDFYNRFKNLEAKKDDSIDKELSIIERKLSEIKQVIKSLYLDRVRGIIDEEMFLNMSKEYSKDRDSLNNRYLQLLEKKKEYVNDNMNTEYIEIIKEFANFKKPDKNILAKLIERIEISNSREIFIHYKFQNPYK